VVPAGAPPQVHACMRQVLHPDPQCRVHRWVADAEAKDKATSGRLRNERGALRACIGVAQVDVGDPFIAYM
jgi:hypothetical protein